MQKPLIHGNFCALFREWMVKDLSENRELILETKNLSKYYKTYDGKTFKACENINLKLYKGETLGIVGESGSGKTTCIRLIMNLEKPTSGEIIYKGKNLCHLSSSEIRESRKKIQMIFQDPWTVFNPKMNVLEILTEALTNFNKIKNSKKEEAAIKLLKSVDLPEDFLYKYPQNMSGGQRQRLSIARALSLEPEILICDEATSALDVSVQRNIIELLLKLQRKHNLSIIFVCHDLALINAFAHEIVVMNKGELVEKLKGGEVKKAENPYTKQLLASVFTLNMTPYRKEQTMKKTIS